MFYYPQITVWGQYPDGKGVSDMLILYGNSSEQTKFVLLGNSALMVGIRNKIFTCLSPSACIGRYVLVTNAQAKPEPLVLCELQVKGHYIHVHGKKGLFIW